MTPISVQLYTLRDLAAQDFPGVLKTVAEIGYVGVELAGFNGHAKEEIAALIKELGLKVSGSHTATPTEENIAGVVEEAKLFGYELVISGHGPDPFKTADGTARVAAEFETGAQLAKQHGLTYAFHNHWWEFDTQEGKTIYDTLLELAPTAQSELDIYWAADSGADPAAVISRHSSRIPVLHVKDGDLTPERIHKAVGTGKVDIWAAIGAIDPNVTKWLVVELDGCATDMVEAVRASYEFLTRNGLAVGNR